MRDATANRAKSCLVQAAIAVLLLSGLTSLVFGIIFLLIAILLASTGFEWDGPIIWDRVAGCTIGPIGIGIMLIAFANTLKREALE